MSVTDGERVILIQEDWGAIGDGGTVQLGVICLAEGDDVDLTQSQMKYGTQKVQTILLTHRPVCDLDLELGVLLADNRKLDPNVATLSSPKQTLLRTKH